MTVIMIDSTHSSVPDVPVSAPKVALYNTGTADIIATVADWARFPNSGHIIINQEYDSTETAQLVCHVFDVEAGAWAPGSVPALVNGRIQAGIQWTTVYGTPATIAAIRQALNAYAADPAWYYGHVDAWVADWNLDEAQAVAMIGTELDGILVRAVQFASPTSNPGMLVPGSSLTLAEANVDLSVTQDCWHAYC
jgi:hypothetical protein